MAKLKKDLEKELIEVKGKNSDLAVKYQAVLTQKAQLRLEYDALNERNMKLCDLDLERRRKMELFTDLARQDRERIRDLEEKLQDAKLAHDELEGEIAVQIAALRIMLDNSELVLIGQ